MDRKSYPIRRSCGISGPYLPQVGSQEHNSNPHPSQAFFSNMPGHILSFGNLTTTPMALSLAELPHLVAKVGSEVAMGESVWKDGPHFMTSALGVDIPVEAVKVQPEEETAECAVGRDTPLEKPTDPRTAECKAKPRMKPLTGMEVWETLTQRRHFGMFQFVHLNVVDSNSYRPYDLRVVPRGQAGPEHYVFSPTCVLHVRDGCCVGLSTLTQWHHEAMLWSALQEIPFFRDFRLRKTLTRWRWTVCQLNLHRRCRMLQGQLLMAVPHFREALTHLSRLIEELKQVQWLPQDASHTYTLREFRDELRKKNQESRKMLTKFLQHRTFILHMVQEESYGTRQDIQLQMGHLDLSQCRRSQRLQQAELRSLRRELGHANHVLQRLGNMTTLVNQMVVQNITTIICMEVKSFVIGVLKRQQSHQVSLFQAELIFGDSEQLTTRPPMHLFQDALQSAVLSVAESTLQVFDSSNGSPDYRTTGFSGTKGPTDSNSLLDAAHFPVKADQDASPAPRSVVPTLNPSPVEGQRFPEQCYPLYRKQLEWQLSLKAETQEAEREQARITQEALMEVKQMCESYSWLVDIHLFTCQWSTASLEAMRGWSCHQYGQQIQQVRAWHKRLLSLPAFYTTSNNLLTVHCSHLLEKIVPVLRSIEEEVLTLLVGELKQRTENLASELRKAVDDLKTEPSDFSSYTHYASMVTPILVVGPILEVA